MHYILIDYQDFFKNIGSYQNSLAFNRISDFLNSLDLEKENLTIVYDTLLLILNNKHDISHKIEMFSQFFNYPKDVLKNHEHFFQKDLDFNLIDILIKKQPQNISFKTKEYGYLRNAIDFHKKSMFFIGKALQFLYANSIDTTEEKEILFLMKTMPLFHFIIQQINTLENCNTNKTLLILKENYFDAGFVLDRYKHIKKTEEILLMGGGGCECLLEEYLSLKLLGYNNIVTRNDLIYGNDPTNDFYLIEEQYLKFDEFLKKIFKLIF